MKIIVAGDFCPQDRIERLIATNQYETILSEVKPLIEEADYALVNMECPVVIASSAKAIDKIGPNLKTDPKAVELIKHAGFSGVTLANNHILDYGCEGVNDTLSVCEKLGIDSIGAGLNAQEAANILYKNIGSKRIGFINCCEQEFNIATEKTAGANPINPICQYYAIQEARAQCDYVVVIIHGGHEYFQYPSLRMRELYRFYIDVGVDAVVNHHQHCFCGYELYQGKPIFYGIGNFCFDAPSQRKSIWNEGFLVELDFTSKIKFKIIPYVQCDETPAVVCMKGDRKDVFFHCIDHFNTVISDDKALTRIHQDWMQKNSTEIKLAFSPYQNRILRAAFYRGLLPKGLTKLKRLRLIDYIACESHREITLDMLKRGETKNV